MGGKAKIILPLVALGAAFATGPAGLGMWGAAAPAGATATSTAAALGGAASAIPVATEALGAQGLANVLQVTGGWAAEQAASTGFFSALASDFGALSGIDKIGLGMKAVSALGGVSSAISGSNAAETAIALQENEQSMIEATNRADTAIARRDSEDRLGRVLAAQRVYFATAGINPATGSAGQLARGAVVQAENEGDLVAARAGLAGANSVNARRLLALRRKQASGRGLGSAFGSLLDFGIDTTGTLSKRARVG